MLDSLSVEQPETLDKALNKKLLMTFLAGILDGPATSQSRSVLLWNQNQRAVNAMFYVHRASSMSQTQCIVFL